MISPFMRLDRNFRLKLRRTTTKLLFVLSAVSIPLGSLNTFGQFVRANTAVAMDLALDRAPASTVTIVPPAPNTTQLLQIDLTALVEKPLAEVMSEVVFGPLHAQALTPLEFTQEKISENIVCSVEPTPIEISAQLPETLYLSEPEQIESLQHQPNERQFGVEFPPLSPGTSRELYRISSN